MSYRTNVGYVGFLEDESSRDAADHAPDKARLSGFAEKAPKPDTKTDTEARRQPGRLSRDVTPNSRHPLIEPEVRAKIEAVEPEARRLGWPAELLWNANYWDLPRGLAAVLDQDDEIAEVSAEEILVLKYRRDLLHFRRTV